MKETYELWFVVGLILISLILKSRK